MAEPSETGVFLERRSYRRRRLIDGLKVLPFLGAWLFLLPVFWPGEGVPESRSMSGALYYVFGAWLGLILLTAILVRSVRRGGTPDEGSSPAGQEEGTGEARMP